MTVIGKFLLSKQSNAITITFSGGPITVIKKVAKFYYIDIGKIDFS